LFIFFLFEYYFGLSNHIYQTKEAYLLISMIKKYAFTT